MAVIKIVVEADTQQEVDMYCDMINDMCQIRMYRNRTINRHCDGQTWKKTTMTILDYMLKDDYKVKHKNDNHKCANCKWFDGEEHCFSEQAKSNYAQGVYRVRIHYPDSRTDCGGWESKEKENDR
jgi:hypothetical protein